MIDNFLGNRILKQNEAEHSNNQEEQEYKELLQHLDAVEKFQEDRLNYGSDGINKYIIDTEGDWLQVEENATSYSKP